MKSYRDQLKECNSTGMRNERVFESFKDNPGILPLIPSPSMKSAIKTGEWKGIIGTVCGMFGGQCHSGHEECKKHRRESI
jgi:hypothetical protein